MASHNWIRITCHSCLGGVVSYLIRDRLDFVAKCYANGNTLRGCSCTFSALPKLSSNYQDLARSWAIDSSKVYVRSILYSLAKETLKASTGISKDLVGNDADAKSYAGWLRTATNAVGWPQTKRVIEGTAQVLATTAAAKTIVVPIVLAGSDLQSARDTMGQACGVHPAATRALAKRSSDAAS